MPNKDNSDQLPEAVFHAIATTIQRLVFIVEEECDIKPMDLLALWFVDYFGVLNEKGQSVILRRDLTQMLTLKFRMSDAQISRTLDELQNRGLVERPNLSREHRERLFKSGEGPKLAVVLTEAGNKKFELFKKSVSIRYDRWLKSLNRPARVALKAILPLTIQTANWIIKRYDPVVLAKARQEGTVSKGAGDMLQE